LAALESPPARSTAVTLPTFTPAIRTGEFTWTFAAFSKTAFSLKLMAEGVQVPEHDGQGKPARP